jgi:proteasome lid subunit RPN8/RPN11
MIVEVSRTRLDQALVALHAAAATRHVPIVAEQHEPAIRIWQTSESSANVTAIDIPVFQVTRQTVGEWTVVYDEGLIETIKRLRVERLPNETGGVLIGRFDFERKAIYVVDTIPSPLDSQERRTLYIRGSAGLQEQLEFARQRTFDQLEYVGEWHSHPDGYDCLPSVDDLNVLAWLSCHMDTDGLPGVMMIACEQTAVTVLLAHVQRPG